MKSCGRYSIYLTGSQSYTQRVVYEAENGKFYIKWYGNVIEVYRGVCGGYATVEKY